MESSLKQFVIQQHTTPDGIHWDLMLEADDVLWTWRISVPPEQIGQDSIAAQRIADHPIRFLTYEGPVQNQTGSVQIADRGEYVPAVHGKIRNLTFYGHLLSGSFVLTQKTDGWTFQRTSP